MREKREGRGSVSERNGKKRGGEREGRGEASPLPIFWLRTAPALRPFTVEFANSVLAVNVRLHRRLQVE